MSEDRNSFIESCEQQAERMRTLAQSGNREIISGEMAFAALVIVYNLRLSKVGDFLLYASAINALSAYAAQSQENREAIGKDYLQKTDLLCKNQKNHPSDLVRIELQKSSEKRYRMYYEISAIQFLFEEIRSGNYSKDFAVPEGEPGTLAYDNVDKQLCADSLYRFAESNAYERTNEMMDGSNLEESLNLVLESYRNGTRTFADVKKELDFEVIRQENAEDEYEFQNRAAMILYQGKYASFYSALRNRTLVNHICEKYEELTGYTATDEIRNKWNYAFEAVAFAFRNAAVNPELGTRVDYVRGRDTDHLNLVLVSGDDAGSYCSVIQLLPWKTMEVISSRGTVEYTEAGVRFSMKDQHPSKQVSAYCSRICRGLENMNPGHVANCTFFYDTPRTESSDIEPDWELVTMEETPCFYSDEPEQMVSFVVPTISRGNGVDTLLKMDRDSPQASTDILVDEIKHIVSRIRIHCEEDDSFLIAVYVRICTALAPEEGQVRDYLQRGLIDPAVREIIRQLFQDSGLVLSEEQAEELEEAALLAVNTKDNCNFWEQNEGRYNIFINRVPDQIDYSATPYNLLFLDPYSLTERDKQQIEKLRDAAGKEEVEYRGYTMAIALGYADRGAGNDCMIQELMLGLPNYQQWDPTAYPIRIADSEEDFSGEEGVANVTLDKSYTLERLAEDNWQASDECCRLYDSLAVGAKGLCLLIEDPDLRDSLRTDLEEKTNQWERLAAYAETTEQDEDWMETIRGLAGSDSTVYNRYADYAAACLGVKAWSKMSGDSRDFVISSLLSYDDMKDYNSLMDFSGVDLMISKAFEVELSARLVSIYEDWIRNEYGEDYMEHIPTELLKTKSDGTVTVKKASDTTLGDMPYVMGMDSKGKIYRQDEYDQFVYFCEDYLMADCSDVDGTLRDLCKIIDHVRTKYRNPAAHKDTIDVIGAKDCLDYCIVEQRKLGVVMDMFRE